MIRSEKQYIAQSTGNQCRAPQQKRTHQNLAQLRIELNKRDKIFTIHFDDFARLGSTKRHECATPRQHCHFSAELSFLQRRDSRFSIFRLANRVDASLCDDKELVDLFSSFTKYFALLHSPTPPVRRNSRNLRRCQRRK